MAVLKAQVIVPAVNTSLRFLFICFLSEMIAQRFDTPQLVENNPFGSFTCILQKP